MEYEIDSDEKLTGADIWEKLTLNCIIAVTLISPGGVNIFDVHKLDAHGRIVWKAFANFQLVWWLWN